ncbi:MAG: hypothetical protein A2133_11920 [Actinobacteria bacterium RBG_16_64_13]|nr:MAG: hypothetical protein A2133_11920 [Actinobacteria bacterium RBG_16_64_13]
MSLRLGGLRQRAGRLGAIAARISRERGFTLIELMVAVLLLLIVMAGIVPFYLSTLAQASTLRYKSLATNIARERMEEIRQLDYREIESAGQLTARFGSTATQRDITFAVTYDVQESSYDEGVLKQVTVNVSWTGPPEPSEALISTMIHQQYLGPRGGYLTVRDQSGAPYDTVPGTPFWLVKANARIKYHIAEADWGLIFSDLGSPGGSERDVYARFVLVDDGGNSIPLGPSANDYKLGTRFPYDHLDYTTAADGTLTDVWFVWQGDSRAIPDGYWEVRAVAYNIYEQPGNTWRVRLRVENGAPKAPTGFVAQVPNYYTVNLFWVPGPERDRDYFVLERSIDGVTWATLESALDPDATSYVNQGSVDDPPVDPWGSETQPNSYFYRLHAVDDDWWDPSAPNVGTAETVLAYIGGSTTTTITSSSSTTTTSSSTTTTTSGQATYSVLIQNQTNKNYSITIKDSENVTVFSDTAPKNSTLTVPDLAAGEFQIIATCSGRPTLTQSFSLPAQAGMIVMTIL